MYKWQVTWYNVITVKEETSSKLNIKCSEERKMTKMTKEMIGKLNNMAAENFEKAQAMLDGINMVLGTEYGWLNGRVVFFDDTSSVARKYATAHDAYVYAE